MKKFDYFILTALALEMIVTYIFRLSLSAGILVILTTMLPLVVLALVEGRFIQSISNKFSVFNILASAIITTLIVLPYSLLFPWQEILKTDQSGIAFSPSVGSIVSTLITQIILTSLVFIIVKHARKESKEE